MKIKVKIKTPVFPNYLILEEDHIKRPQAPTYPIGLMDEEDFDEYLEIWKKEFKAHWKFRNSLPKK